MRVGNIVYGHEASTGLPVLVIAKLISTYTVLLADVYKKSLPKSDNNCGKCDKHLSRAIKSGILWRFSRKPHSINFLGIYLPEF